MHHSQSVTIDTSKKFELEYAKKVQLLLMSEPVNRGPAHATSDETMALTHELTHVTEAFYITPFLGGLQSMIQPNLPWAEDHFEERVGGKPLNPSPSEAWWPFARAGNAEHKHNEVFSHTYPERFWPKWTNHLGSNDESPIPQVNWGIRFEFGDLNDLLEILRKNVNSRQAYLPIWFPEDLTAARKGQRVPCSMGYHFLMVDGALDCVYTMRSCDIVRFYRDDIYMAGRLLQWVSGQTEVPTGKLVVHIDNLHCFPGDRPFLEKYLIDEVKSAVIQARSHYNFDALG